MEAFSDDEFDEARDEISSASGSDVSADEDGQQKFHWQNWHQTLRQDQPRRAPQQRQWSESLLSVWQEGPKSIQDRRSLLYDRFEVLCQRNGNGEGEEDVSNSYDGTKIRRMRLGMRDKHLSPVRKGLRKAENFSFYETSESSSEPRDGQTDNVARSKTIPLRRQRLKGLKDVGSMALGRSRSDSAALVSGITVDGVESGLVSESSLGSLTHAVCGNERLRQTTGAVLREGEWGQEMSLGLRLITGSLVNVASKLASSNLHSLTVESTGASEFSSHKREHMSDINLNVVPEENPNRNSKNLACPEVIRHTSMSSISASAKDLAFDPAVGHPPADYVGELVNTLQRVAGTARSSNQNPSAVREENVNDITCKIRDLDNGKEFLIDEIGTDGYPKLREPDTGRELTFQEFETSLGLSPVMQEVSRSEREQDNVNAENDGGGHDFGPTTRKKEKKSVWVRTMKGVAKTVGASSKPKSPQDDPKLQVGGSGQDGAGVERDGSVGRNRREDSLERSTKPQPSRMDNSSDGYPRSPQRVKVHVYKKNYRDLSNLNLRQEIQAHQGAIRALKFSLDGRYLASAGQDRVVHVREVLDHPRDRDQHQMHVLERGVDKGEATVISSAERSQQSQEGSTRRGSLRGSAGVRKSSKGDHDSITMPKLFWLSDTTVCSFKGHMEDVVDLSWSRSQFLLSSSMDKTVRLWHISCGGCLRVFEHSDFVTCIQFSPIDDRYFLSGSLDDKVRIWSIPDHQVVDWSDVREMVTAANVSPDGKRAVIGTYKGTCRFFNTTGHKLQLEGQIDVRNAQSRKSRGPKITGLQFMPGESNKVLITSNDSRVRVYDGLQQSLKLKGLRNVRSEISASFNKSGDYVISASEDSRVYIWNSSSKAFGGSRKDKPVSYERFTSGNVSIAVPWQGMDNQAAVNATKEDHSELEASCSRQSAHEAPLRSVLRCSPSSSLNGSRQSDSGHRSESDWDCKVETSLGRLGKKSSDAGAADEETLKRGDRNGSLGHNHKQGNLLCTASKDSPGRSFVIPACARSSVSTASNDSPLVGHFSLRSPGPTFFEDVTAKSSATWPEENLPTFQEPSRSRGGTWSDPSPSQAGSRTQSPGTSSAGNATSMATWGLVIVTASLSGKIRTFQNYGYPIRL